MTPELKPVVLVVDDETSIRESFSLILQDQYNVVGVASGEAAVKKIVDSSVDLVYLDIRMPGIDGIETLRKIKDIDDTIEVVMVTAVNDIQKAGEAIRIGANNYIVKPFDVDQIIMMTKALTGKKILKHETKKIRNGAKSRPSAPEIPGVSKQISDVTARLDKLSSSDATVLFTGERGSDVERFAFFVHLKSGRKALPFKVIDIAQNIQEDILYDRLFGSGKGSFINALEKDTGIIEEAAGGSVLILNIENAPLTVQDALLKFISERSFNRRGSLFSLSADVRVMFFSCKDLKSLADEGAFSAKLLSLCKDSSVEIPPLNRRKEDIASITSDIMEELNTEYNRSFKELSRDALDILSSYSWPGDECELKSLLRRVICSRDQQMIRASDLPYGFFLDRGLFPASEETRQFSLAEMSSKFEKNLIRGVLKKCNFDLKKTAQALNITKTALTSKIETLEIA
ncbi:MAG: sigma-54 dependent transcriptional regulator [Candidatus Saganbacteria bacterium]|nr:sigma-54 dependent transcriptional regulator [Candidatus Saganbacteria bacterium]